MANGAPTRQITTAPANESSESTRNALSDDASHNNVAALYQKLWGVAFTVAYFTYYKYLLVKKSAGMQERVNLNHLTIKMHTNTKNNQP